MYKNLSHREASALLQKFGPNEITAVHRYSLLKSFLGQFNNFLTLLLLAAGAISFLLGERVDAIFIFLIVGLNVGFGVYQEFKAEKSLEALKKITVTLVRVIRDDKEQTIDSKELVPGDLIYLEEGSKIPADAILIKTWNLEVNEASLTGESLPVIKHESRQEIREIFMGTVVSKGRSYAHVYRTGNDTNFGRIAQTLALIEEEPTPLQKKLAVFTRQIGIIGIIAAVTVFALSFLRDKNAFESFLFAVSLAVAAVPEGLPAVMTITLAIGVDKMSKEKAIVRKLNAIETLGSVTLVATDKTGTLTTNEMKVKKIWVDGKTYDTHHAAKLKSRAFDDLTLNGILCSTASLVLKVEPGHFDVIGDTTEGALLLMAKDLGMNPESIKAEWEVIEEQPFDATIKRMTVVVKKGGTKRTFTKGSPEAILEYCIHIFHDDKVIPLDDKKRSEINKEFEIYARKGLRMLAFAEDNVFLGFVGIADPVRPEVADAVKKAYAAGIRVVMLTGDSPLTAEAIGLETGIIRGGEDILTGAQIDEFSDEELLPILDKVRIFARISPNHKYRLVKLFQKKGEVIAVTGDGVNDALALKQADVGVAMGLTGTDVAKETADMVITDDNFATLIHAIERGRNIFNRIQSAIKYLLACNAGEIIYILVAVLGGVPVLLPLQILYINLFTDGLPALSLAFAPGDPDVMQRKPRKTMTLLERKDFWLIGFVGIFTALLAILSSILYKGNISLTMGFSVIILAQPFVLMSLWTTNKNIWKKPKLLLKPIFLASFLFPFLLHPILLYTPFLQRVFKVEPLNALSLMTVLLLSALILVFMEAWKLKKKY